MKIGELVIGWQYSTKDHPIGKKISDTRTLTVEETTCNIFKFKAGTKEGDKSERNLIAFGTVGRYSSDHADKELARIKSLTKALEALTKGYMMSWDGAEQRRLRTMIWTAYWNSKPVETMVMMRGRRQVSVTKVTPHATI